MASRHPRNGGQFKAGSGVEADVGANHDDVAVGEVQHLCDAVHHGVAQRDDGVDASQADPADEKTQKGHSLVTSYLFSFRGVAKLAGKKTGQCGSEKGPVSGPFRPALLHRGDNRSGLYRYKPPRPKRLQALLVRGNWDQSMPT